MYQSGYDPISETEVAPSRRKFAWIAGLAFFGLVVTYRSRTSTFDAPQSTFDYTSVIPKGNAMTCLQSSCNSLMAGIAMNYDDPESQNLTSCLTFANDEATQRGCFDSPIVKTSPQAYSLYLCAICKQCIQGSVSQKKCDSLPRSENDLRGPPSSAGGGYGFDYSQYISPLRSTRTSTLWASFLTDVEGGASPIVPTGVIPDVADGISSALADANAHAAAGLAQAPMDPAQRAKIQDKIASRLQSVDDKVSDRLDKVAEKLDQANDKAAAGIEKGQEKEAAGIQRGQEKAEAGMEKGQEKEAAGIERGQEKAAAGIERGQEKEAAGIERGQEKAAAGIQRGQEKEAAGIQRGQEKEAAGMEKAADGIERGQEKEAAGIERGQDKAAAGIERGQDKQAAGLDRANAQIEKHLDNNPNVPANVPAYVPKLGVFGAQVGPQTLDSQGVIAGTSALWSKFLGEKKAGGLDVSNLVAAKPAKKPLSLKQEKSRLNACMQLNCNSAVAAVGANAPSSPLSRCLQASKTAEAMNKCFKAYPSPQGHDLKVCLLCHQCIPGSTPSGCNALGSGPNDIRGP